MRGRAGRAETLSSVFVFAALLLYLHAPRGGPERRGGSGASAGAADAHRSHGALLGALFILVAYLCVVVAILCKVPTWWHYLSLCE
jgi:hypothetical protein